MHAFFREKSDISSNELDGMVRLVEKAMDNNYRVSDKYPLLAIVNTLSPWKIVLTNLADEQHPLISLDFS